MTNVIDKYLKERTQRIVVNFISCQYRNAIFNIAFAKDKIMVKVDYCETLTTVSYNKAGACTHDYYFCSKSPNDHIKRLLIQIGIPMGKLAENLLKDLRREIINAWSGCAKRLGLIKDLRIHIVKLYLLPYLLKFT